MQTIHNKNDCTDFELLCPVPGCTYSARSAQSVSAHVGSGHSNGWDTATVGPSELHEAASRADPKAAYRIGKVEAWLSRNDISTDALRIYEHAGYGNIQIRVIDHLGNEWDTYQKLVRDTDGVHYNGDVNWLEDEFVDQLPDVEEWEVWIPTDASCPIPPNQSHWSVNDYSRTELVGESL